MSSSVRLVVRNESGIHLRPLSVFVKAAASVPGHEDHSPQRHDRQRHDERDVGALLSSGLKAKKDHEIEVTADGPQEAEALEAIRQAVESGLGEEIA